MATSIEVEGRQGLVLMAEYLDSLEPIKEVLEKSPITQYSISITPSISTTNYPKYLKTNALTTLPYRNL